MCVCPHPHIGILLLWVWWEHLRSILLASFKRILHYWSPNPLHPAFWDPVSASFSGALTFLCQPPFLTLLLPSVMLPELRESLRDASIPLHSSQPHYLLVSVAIGILMLSALPRVLTFHLSSRLIYSIKPLYLHISWVPQIQHFLHTFHILISWYELQPFRPLPVFVMMPLFLGFPDPASWVLAFKSLSFLNSF